MKAGMKYFVLGLMMSAVMLLTACGGKDEQPKEEAKGPNVSRSFVAPYEKTVTMGEQEMAMKGRVLMNLYDDGSAKIYESLLAEEALEQAQYDGTWTVTESAEGDEVLNVAYQYEEGTEGSIKDAVILDGEFSSAFYMVHAMTADPISFYEVAPISFGGNDGYVGFLSKATGMGTMIYAYYLEMAADGTFHVSIMQRSAVMFIQGEESGTYTEADGKLTFTYDVNEDAETVVAEDFVSEGTRDSADTLTAGFNIGQAAMPASAAEFIKVRTADAEE